MNIKPLGERVLVKPVEVEEKTKSGIVLPDTASKEKPSMSEIIAVGDGEEVTKLNVGEKIVHAKYAGTEIKDGEEKYLILNNDECLAVVKD